MKRILIMVCMFLTLSMQAQNDSILVKSGYILKIENVQKHVYTVYIDKGGYFILMQDRQTGAFYKQYIKIRNERN